MNDEKQPMDWFKSHGFKFEVRVMESISVLYDTFCLVVLFVKNILELL